MKKMLLFPLLMALTMLATAQTNPNVIDFEPNPSGNLNGCGGYAQNEGDPLDNPFFQCAYGITFHMGSLGGPEPIVAEVGAPTIAWGSATTFSYSSALGCTVPTSVSSDKPTNTKDIGCFMITDDDQGPGQNPEPLFVDYHDLECSEASGFLMDVDGTGSVQEGWRITAHGVGGSTHTVYVLSPDFNLYTTPPTPQTNLNGGDGEASYWAVNLGTDHIDYIVFEYIGHPSRGVGLAFDEFAICSPQPQFTDVPTRGCCDDEDNPNLIVNGSFEAGNIGFNGGGYSYQPSIGPNSVREGEYTVVTGTDASKISNCWNITDHTFCSDDEGHFMVVNGRTHNPQVTLVYSQPDIEVEEGEEYIFCMYYQHLPQCAFDVFSPDNLNVFVSGTQMEISDCETGGDDCGWTKISYTVIPSGNTVSIDIFLNEGGIGDGNDVAFDDFTLRKKKDVPASTCGFDVNSQTSGSNIVFTANSFSPIPAGFDVTWTVMEIDCITRNPIPGTSMTYAWPPNTTNFPGYCCTPGGGSPGAFTTGKCYRIIRNVTNCCYKDCNWMWEWISTPMPMIEGAAKQVDDEPEKPFNGYYHYQSINGQDFTPVNLIAANDNGLTVFPNPGDGHVTISAIQSLEGSHLVVYSADGRVVLEQNINDAATSVNITKLPNGIYSFKVSQADGKVITKTYVKQ